MLGPLAGGELLALGSWRWIFLINMPLVIACVMLILARDPAERAPVRQRGLAKRAGGSTSPGRRVLCAALGLGGARCSR